MSPVIRFWVKLHKGLRYAALVALSLFALSALSHPVMIWTGPQPQRMHPPAMMLQPDAIANVQSILRQYQLTDPLLVKVVPTDRGIALQVTERESDPRRYFDLSSGNEWMDYDEQQAIWLTRYYTGRSESIRDIRLIKEFSTEYPWVNRLLPVYKITLDAGDGYTVYVHTETSALAAINNHWKNSLQYIFRNLHTFSWLDQLPIIRIGLMSAMLVVLLLMVVGGLIQLIGRNSKVKIVLKRRAHRLMGWVLFVPLSGLLLSGLFHLQFQQFAENQRGMRMSGPIRIADRSLAEHLDFIEGNSLSVNSLSLIEANGKLLYRAGFPPSENQQSKAAAHNADTSAHLQPTQRERRFNGIPVEGPSVYIDAESGKTMTLTDADMAKQLAKDFIGNNAVQIESVVPIHHFGPEYDFRNKRLPVWKVTTSAPDGHRIFIDPATSIIVDYLNPLTRIEGYSFSLLHKWDFMVPLAGRKVRDSIVVVTLIGFLLIALLGVRMAKRSQVSQIRD